MNLQTSPNDHKQYQQIELDNGLCVLLIHDAKATLSAAALAINLGHFDDPQDREGMSHFLEHMLFLGTEKYPNTGGFQKFISMHGGNNNAWTGSEHSCYFFDIEHKFLPEALDRFSQFFISPTFEEDAVDKERQTINNEYQLKIKDDVRRLFQVKKETLNPKHPFAKFSVGNHQTLADRNGNNIRDELLAFYKKYNSANLMTLTVQCNLPLEEIETLVRFYFDQVPNTGIIKPEINEPLARKQDLGRILYVKPRKHVRTMIMSFYLPHRKDDYRSKSSTYIAHLLGYEGKGSLVSYFRKLGWVNSLSAGGGSQGSNYCEFTVTVAFSMEGKKHIPEIIDAIFTYLKLIKDKGIDAWRYKEKMAVQETSFLYQEQKDPIDNVTQLAVNMHHYKDDDVLYGDYMMSHFDPDDINAKLSAMTAEKMRLTIITRGGFLNKNAKWYDTPYGIATIPPELIKRWSSPKYIEELSLPAKNPFIVDDPVSLFLELPEHDKPRLLENQSGFRLWYKQDKKLKTPKGVIYISFDSQHAVSSAERIVMSRLGVALMLDFINEDAYQAEMAGLNYNIYAHQGGFTIKLFGFTDKQELLLNLILDKYKLRHFNKDRFDIIKTQITRNWRNSKKERPIGQLYNCLTGILQPNNPPYSVLLEALENVKLKDLDQFVEDITKENFIDVFVYGNWHQQHAHIVGDHVKQNLRLKGQNYKEVPRPLRMIDGHKNIHFEYLCKQNDAAVIIYYQGNEISPREVALYLLASHLISTPFYEELRTEKQLGYMLGCHPLALNQHPGLIFFIQSPVASSKMLVKAIDVFISNLSHSLNKISQEHWDDTKSGLVTQILTPEPKMMGRGQDFWTSIGSGDWDFEQKNLTVDALHTLALEHIIAFINQKLLPEIAHRLIVTSPCEDCPDEDHYKGDINFDTFANIQSYLDELKV